MATARRSSDLVVVSALRDWTCADCATDERALMVMDDRGPLCLDCADLGHLEFLGAGNTALTRRARTHSGLSAVVIRFSRMRRRYERQGILVEPQAIAPAEEECLGDEEVRARQRERAAARRADEDVEFVRTLAHEIEQLFPGCPPDRVEEIAAHTGARGSGRVGRTAAARAADPQAITLAVAAAARHGRPRTTSS